MKIAKTLILTILVLVGTLLVLSFFIPSKYEVKRTIIIKAPVDSIFVNIENLRKWDSWSPWKQKDPLMESTYSENPKGEGAWTSWQSEVHGSGQLQITDIKPGEHIAYELKFEDFDMTARGTFQFEETSEGTKVTWTDKGDVGRNPISKYMILFIDKMIGPDFEQGLENLRKITE